jgi:hypothetical protein
MQVGPRETYPRSHRDSATVDKVGAVTIDEIRKARGATDPRQSHDLLVLNLAFLQDFVIGSENGEVTATGAPGRVVGSNRFLGEFLAWWFGNGCITHKCLSCRIARGLEFRNQEARKKEDATKRSDNGLIASFSGPVFSIPISILVS